MGSGSVDHFRRPQVERPESGIENMAAHIAEGTGAEINPGPPGFWVIVRVVVTVLGGP